MPCLRLFLVVTLLSALPAIASSLVYYGVASEPGKPGNILYREQHQLTHLNGQPQQRTVEYFDREGTKIAEKTNHYSENLSQPSFELIDFRRNYRETLSHERQGIRLTLQENEKQEETLLQQHDYPLVIDAGFDEFVRQHWQVLTTGSTVPFSFASVARQDSINFRLEAINPQQQDQPLHLTMTLTSAWLAWLLDPIELRYDRQLQRLLSYQGLSNISDAQGAGQQVFIQYYYPATNSAAVNNEGGQ